MDGYWHNNTTAGSALLRKPILLLFITVMMNTLSMDFLKLKFVNSPEEIEGKTKAASLAVEAKCFPCFTCSPDLFWSFKHQIWVQALGPHWYKAVFWHVWGQISFIQLEHLSKLDYCSDRSPVTFPPSLPPAPVSCRKKGKNIIPTPKYEISLGYLAGDIQKLTWWRVPCAHVRDPQRSPVE